MSSLVDNVLNPYFLSLRSFLTQRSKGKELLQAVVDAPFSDKLSAARVDLGIVALLLVNKKSKMIEHVTLSDSELAGRAVNMSSKPFKSIKIPIGYKKNMIAKAISSGKPQKVSDWQYLFVPALTPVQARLNQSGAGVDCSVVYPLIKVRDGGALVFSFYQPPENITDAHLTFLENYVKLASEVLSI